ncbi:unnamed protein product [Brachionus calyciflorus]|uniref:MARVEL domain-containing protein n=1 Tax=Brachionus calyciflorus TaxID=104777 RepID=A0A813WRW0_9BILA|nr:unnamed protein product [Brachionus calyciflorus]
MISLKKINFGRIPLFLILLGGLISAGSIGDTQFTPDEFHSIRIAYMVVAAVAICACIAIFVLILADFTDYIKIFVLVDLFFALALLSVSIAAAIAESDLKKFSNLLASFNSNLNIKIYDIYDYVRKDVFAIAAGFGFGAFIIYCVLIVLEIIIILKKKY